MPSAPAPLSTSRFVSFLRMAFPNLLSGQAFGATPNRLGSLGKSPGRPGKAYLRPGAKAHAETRSRERAEQNRRRLSIVSPRRLPHSAHTLSASSDGRSEPQYSVTTVTASG